MVEIAGFQGSCKHKGHIFYLDFYKIFEQCLDYKPKYIWMYCTNEIILNCVDLSNPVKSFAANAKIFPPKISLWKYPWFYTDI